MSAPVTIAAEPSTPLDPEPILRLASGFMAAKHLFAAHELGLFEALAEGPARLDALAARTGLTSRAARISADAMVALGFVERDGVDGHYRNGALADAFLSGRGPADLRPLLTFWDRISYPAWSHLARALATGPPTEILELDDELQAVASTGIEAVLAGPASALPAAVDLRGRRRLLDVGGGTGSWSIAAVRATEQLTATVLELPAVAALARERAAAAGLGGRVDVVVGDALAGDLPGGHDVFLLANVVHYWSPATNRALLDRLRRAAPPGGLLLLADFWTDAGHTRPVQAAMMAGEFAVHLADGDVYSVDEVGGWLAQTGWRVDSHCPLVGPQSVVVARAV